MKNNHPAWYGVLLKALSTVNIGYIDKNTCLPSQMSTVSDEQKTDISASHIESDK
jgi:hypothetical protein